MRETGHGVQLGEVVVRRPVTFFGREEIGRSAKRRLKGRVVYIHPQGRYHTVEFDLPGGRARESFRGTGA